MKGSSAMHLRNKAFMLLELLFHWKEGMWGGQVVLVNIG